MTNRPSPRRLRAGGLAVVAGIACLIAAVPAFGVDAPTQVATNSARNQTAPWTFTWTEATPGPGESIVGYVGGPALPDDPAPSVSITSGGSVAVPEAARTFYVAAILDGGVIGPYASIAIAPDYTAPTGSATPQGTQGVDGWYRNLKFMLTCRDAPFLITCPDLVWNEDGNFGAGARNATITDGAGNQTLIPLVPAFKFDKTPPNPGVGQAVPTFGQPLQPGNNALVAAEPVFTWTRGFDEGSGVDRYQLQWRRADADDWTTMATDVKDPTVGDPSASRVTGGPLPEKVALEWRVVTFDKAGNTKNSVRRDIMIDSTIPASPTITAGPSAPTRTSSPTFSWTGTEQTYLWDVTVAGAQNPVRLGGGPATEATIANLPDGDYTFRVSQVTQAGRESAEASRSFKVDTTPPAPPTILIRPSFPAIAGPVFTWQTEPGAYSRWTLLDAAGTPIIPGTDTPTTSVTLPDLPDGAYTFQLVQIDAAGNVSPATVEPFTMLAPLVPAPGPSSAGAAALPRQNAVRLKPKAGKTLPTRVPVLRWRKGPHGTKLYNVQVFRVVKRRGSSPKISKVLSVFPRGLQMRAPKRRLAAGTCYVWRVWPYTGRAFTAKPIGVSNFCIAGAKVIKKKEAAARARKVAAARRLALARARK